MPICDCSGQFGDNGRRGVVFAERRMGVATHAQSKDTDFTAVI